jgi:hypothetical protein
MRINWEKAGIVFDELGAVVELVALVISLIILVVVLSPVWVPLFCVAIGVRIQEWWKSIRQA